MHGPMAAFRHAFAGVGGAGTSVLHCPVSLPATFHEGAGSGNVWTSA